MTNPTKRCPACRGRFESEFQVCCNCALCFRCARVDVERPREPPHRPAKCHCGHPVVPYGSKEWRVRFRQANPTATLVGRLDGRTLIAKFPGMPHLVKVVGGTPEAPTCVALV